MEDTRLARLKAVLGISGTELDTTLTTYLDMAKDEIIGWHCAPDSEVEDVPKQYRIIQIFAVVIAYNQLGAEGESSETVDGVSHDFSYPTMVDYIHTNIPSYARLL